MYFPGTTATSTGIFSVLQCICRQIIHQDNYNIDCDISSVDDMNILVSKFWDFLKVKFTKTFMILQQLMVGYEWFIMFSKREVKMEYMYKLWWHIKIKKNHFMGGFEMLSDN